MGSCISKSCGSYVTVSQQSMLGMFLGCSYIQISQIVHRKTFSKSDMFNWKSSSITSRLPTCLRIRTNVHLPYKNVRCVSSHCSELSCKHSNVFCVCMCAFAMVRRIHFSSTTGTSHCKSDSELNPEPNPECNR